MVGSTPNCSDLDHGRRPGNFTDYQNLIRLAQHFNVIHMTGGYPVEPIDLPANTRHLDCAFTHLTLTDKVFHAYSLGKQRVADSIDMLCIGLGLSREQLKKQPSLISIINTSSPLRLDGVMIQGMLEMIRNGQSVCVTPFTLSGAMAPVTLAGALSLQNAEALATLAFTQMAAPGAPVIYGGFTSNVDMKSGAPAFGTPELAKSTLIGGQLARRYGLPYRASNVNACNAVDTQAGYESMMSLWPTIQSHCNFVKHAAGWLEGGLCASFEKVIVDVELLQMMSAFLEELSLFQLLIWHLTQLQMSAPADISSVHSTHWRDTKLRFIRQSFLIGATLVNGRKTAVLTPLNVPIKSGSKPCQNIKNRPSKSR
jgi:trimethylamine--corrinoid protein Co-methyltransferase